MSLKVGTFNLNNLFSRFNFASVIDEIQKASGPPGALTVRYEFTSPEDIRIRTYRGKLVKAKAKKDTDEIARRILEMDVDILAVQEVENIDILNDFNKKYLKKRYPHRVLIEGNDNRFIDVGLLSKLPVGAITSFQAVRHKEDPGNRIFSRDLLEVEILDPSGKKKLFTVYNTHLKSHYGDDDDGGNGKDKNDKRRRRQAETIRKIVAKRMRTDARYIIMGDMNDPPAAETLKSLLNIDNNKMFNALVNPKETRPAKAEAGGHDPQSPSWTHRYKDTGVPPRHELYDQIWLSPALVPAFQESFIDRRTKHGGDGSDHDPAWISLDL